MPLFVALALAVPTLLLILAVRRRAEVRRRARLLRAQEEWAEDLDRCLFSPPARARSAGHWINLNRFVRLIIGVMYAPREFLPGGGTVVSY